MNPPLTLVSLPLFPLRTVLFPDGRLTLRVFEQRYRTMVRCCLEQDAPFGVVTLTHSQNEAAEQPAQGRFHPLGTLAKITELSAISPSWHCFRARATSAFASPAHASCKAASGWQMCNCCHQTCPWPFPRSGPQRHCTAPGAEQTAAAADHAARQRCALE